MLWVAVVGLACLLALPLPAAAQKDSVVSLGVGFSLYRPSDPLVENTWGIGLVARLRRASGFGATMGLNWFRGDVNRDIGGVETRVARVLVRPVMFGVGYTRQYGDFAVGGSFVVGYAFNGLRNTGGASDAYAAMGQPGATFEITNSLVYRPTLALWWELGNRFALVTSVSYISARPELITTTPSGVTRQVINIGIPLRLHRRGLRHLLTTPRACWTARSPG